MSQLMIVKNCEKLNTCHKVAMVLDHDILEQQKAEAIVSMCQKCDQRVDK
jgi:hypothetical protein